MYRISYLFLMLAAAGLSACGGGSGAPPKAPVAGNPGNPGNPPAPPVTPSPWTYQACESTADAAPAQTDAAVDGIWQGTLTNERTKTTEPWTAVVSADGRFHLRSTGHTQMAGALDVDGNGYTGEGIARSGGSKWHDGTLVSALTMAGKVAERDRLDGDFVLASGDAGCFRFTYDAALYERPSSLDLVGGRWIDYDDWSFLWVALDVSAQGTISGTDIYGCSYAGSIALQDGGFNLYAVALNISQHTDSYPCWGPGNFEGFAWLEDSSDGSSVGHYLQMLLSSDGNAARFTMNR